MEGRVTRYTPRQCVGSRGWSYLAVGACVGLMFLGEVTTFALEYEDQAQAVSQVISGSLPRKLVKPKDRLAWLAVEDAELSSIDDAYAPPGIKGVVDNDDGFPSLPPDPDEDEKEELPGLEDELYYHGGSYLYCPEGDRLGWPEDDDSHHDYLRLPVNWRAPEPFTAFADFLGADPVRPSGGTWKGPGEYSWEPRFVGHGSYELFGFALEQAGARRDVVGHQLLVDLDLRLTGTERFHVQFRPLGRRNSGGSVYQFNDPSGYESNATAEPDRYWFEGEFHSIFGWGSDPHASNSNNFLLGKFPYVLHNSLLMNDDIVGVVIGRNNLQWKNVSNLNLQLFTGLNDVDTHPFVETQVYGVHASVDCQRTLYELTYAYLQSDYGRDSQYLGASGTKFFGPLSLATRALFKWGDDTGRGSGQLFTIESNWTRVFDHSPFGVHHGVFFCNAFFATEGWNSIAGGNLNRLRTAFEVDPLVRLAAGPAQRDTLGVAIGVQLFRHHEDESLIPEIAWESPDGQTVFGAGLKYQKKMSARSFLEVLGLKNWSDSAQHDREGVFVSHSWLF